METNFKWNEKQKKLKWNNFSKYELWFWSFISVKSWNEHWKYLASLHPAAPPEAPIHPGASWLITFLWSLLIPCTHLTAISKASQGNTRFLKCDPWLTVPGTVVHSGKNLPVVFSLIGSLCWGRGKFSKDLVAQHSLDPPAPSAPKGRQLPVLRACHLLPKN